MDIVHDVSQRVLDAWDRFAAFELDTVTPFYLAIQSAGWDVHSSDTFLAVRRIQQIKERTQQRASRTQIQRRSDALGSDSTATDLHANAFRSGSPDEDEEMLYEERLLERAEALNEQERTKTSQWILLHALRMCSVSEDAPIETWINGLESLWNNVCDHIESTWRHHFLATSPLACEWNGWSFVQTPSPSVNPVTTTHTSSNNPEPAERLLMRMRLWRVGVRLCISMASREWIQYKAWVCLAWNQRYRLSRGAPSISPVDMARHVHPLSMGELAPVSSVVPVQWIRPRRYAHALLWWEDIPVSDVPESTRWYFLGIVSGSGHCSVWEGVLFEYEQKNALWKKVRARLSESITQWLEPVPTLLTARLCRLLLVDGARWCVEQMGPVYRAIQAFQSWKTQAWPPLHVLDMAHPDFQPASRSASESTGDGVPTATASSASSPVPLDTEACIQVLLACLETLYQHPLHPQTRAFLSELTPVQTDAPWAEPDLSDMLQRLGHPVVARWVLDETAEDAASDPNMNPNSNGTCSRLAEACAVLREIVTPPFFMDAKQLMSTQRTLTDAVLDLWLRHTVAEFQRPIHSAVHLFASVLAFHRSTREQWNARFELGAAVSWIANDRAWAAEFNHVLATSSNLKQWALDILAATPLDEWEARSIEKMLASMDEPTSHPPADLAREESESDPFNEPLGSSSVTEDPDIRSDDLGVQWQTLQAKRRQLESFWIASTARVAIVQMYRALLPLLHVPRDTFCNSVSILLREAIPRLRSSFAAHRLRDQTNVRDWARRQTHLEQVLSDGARYTQALRLHRDRLNRAIQTISIPTLDLDTQSGISITTTRWTCTIESPIHAVLSHLTPTLASLFPPVSSGTWAPIRSLDRDLQDVFHLIQTIPMDWNPTITSWRTWLGQQTSWIRLVDTSFSSLVSVSSTNTTEPADASHAVAPSILQGILARQPSRLDPFLQTIHITRQRFPCTLDQLWKHGLVRRLWINLALLLGGSAPYDPRKRASPL